MAFGFINCHFLKCKYLEPEHITNFAEATEKSSNVK